MHVRDSGPERRPRSSAFVLLGLVLLLAVVALASSGHVAAGTGTSRRPGYELADTFLSLMVVFVLLGGVVLVYVYYLQRTNPREKDGRVSRARRALMFFVMLGLLIGLSLRIAIHNHGRNSGLNLRASLPSGSSSGRHPGYTPHFAPIPVAVVLGAGTLAAVAAYLSHRARRRGLGRLALDTSPELTLADVLRETLDDLRAQPDPRVAVIAAYARLERTLAALGMPRRESDAPLEYLERILVELDVGATHASRLTQLFEHAKFSTRPVGQEMKAEAIELLEAIRADLQAADAARAEAAQHAAARVAGQPA